MLKTVAERWKAWRDPQARRIRKARRRQDWNDAASEVEARARRHGPSPTEVELRAVHDRKR